MWLLVELERDRRTRPRRRDIRDGCQAVEELFQWYGKVIPWETIRRQYKMAEKLRKTPAITELFDRHLADLRRKRAEAGWKADPFLLMGYTHDDLVAMLPNMLQIELRQRLNKKAALG